MIRVILADDHQMVVDGLMFILSHQPDIHVEGTASNGEEVLKLLQSKEIDIAVLDIEMPKPNGIQLTRIIRHQYPHIKVLILSMYKTEEFITQIIRSGAMGYILKNKGQEELVDAIRALADGRDYFGHEITRKVFESLRHNEEPASREVQVPLTRREKEVLRLIADGKTSPQIAKELFIAVSTVETHRRNLIDKTEVANSRELIRYALEHGYG